MRDFALKNLILVTLIHERRDYKKLTPSYVLGRILAYELMEEKAMEVKNLVKQSSSSKTKEMSLKASKIKQVEQSSSTEEESSDDEEIALIVMKFKKFLNKGGYSKYKKDKSKRRQSKTAYYECGEVGHFIAECPNKKMNKDKEERRNKPYKKDKRKTHKKIYSGQAHIGDE